MMPLATRLVLAFTLSAALASGLLAWWGLGQLRPHYLEATEEALVDTAEVLAALAAEDWPAAPRRLETAWLRVTSRHLSARIYEVVKSRVDLDCILTDAAGIVRFDSLEPAAVGSDASQWNDVWLTLRGRYGVRATAGRDGVRRLHVAAPVLVDGVTVGVLTVVKPESSVDRFIGLAAQAAMLAGTLAVAGAIFAAGLATWWIVAPLRRLTAYAKRVSAGARPEPPPTGPTEVAALGQALAEMREALEGRAYVEAYVQGLTHELKAPLAGLRAAAEVLAEDPPPAERERFIGHLRGEGQRMQDLIDRLLRLAAVERQTAPRRSPLDVLALVIGECAAAQTTAGPAVTITCEPGPALIVTAESVLLASAVRGLLTNAVTFAPAGSVVTAVVASDGRHAEIRIRDHGPGIPPWGLERLGQRFFSLPHPATGRKGTGLGLAFAKAVADLHGGSLTVRNHREGGAEAVLTIGLD
ncbi:sensor histidine kinase [Planctomycetota bacterium]|nr:sensor histidine kinase [Planctomycetota bacterium]